MPRKTDPADDGPVPLGKGRTEALRGFAPRKDHPDARSYLRECRRLRRALAVHPDTEAARVIRRHLQAAHMHPALAASPELSGFVALMRELLAEHVPGMSLPQMLEPLQTIMARRGGGRPSSDHAAEWCRLVEEKQRRNPSLSDDEACRQIAAEWRDKEREPRSFRTIRDAVRKRKAAGNPLST